MGSRRLMPLQNRPDADWQTPPREPSPAGPDVPGQAADARAPRAPGAGQPFSLATTPPADDTGAVITDEHLVADTQRVLQDLTGSDVTFLLLLGPDHSTATLYIASRESLSQRCTGALLRRLADELRQRGVALPAEAITPCWSAESPAPAAQWARDNLESPLVLPLSSQGFVLGLVGCADGKPPRNVADRFRALEALVSLLSAALQNAQLLSSAQHHLAENEWLFEFGGQLAGLLKLDELRALVSRAALRISPDADLAYICLLDETMERASNGAQPGEGTDERRLCTWLRDQALAQGDTIHYPDLRQAAPDEDGFRDIPFRTAVATPLIIAGRSLGALLVMSSRMSAFRSSDRRLWVALASQVAVAIENAQLYGEIRRQKRHMEAIINHMADGLVVLSHDHRVLSLNPAAEAMLGLNESEVIGWSLAAGVTDPRFEPLAKLCQPRKPPEDLIRHPALLDAEDPGDQGELVVDTPQPRVLKVLSSPIESSADEMGAEIKVLHDVTREHELDQMQRDFVSTVSHELRTPLFSIKGFVDLILHDKVPDPAVRHEFLTRVVEQANHLSAIVSDLLDTSRLEAGSVELNRTRLDLGKVSRSAIAQLESVANSRDVTLDFFAQPDLPSVLGDERRLTQVVTNLASNAVKFSPPQSTVQVRCEADEREVTISVADCGIGIPAEAIPRLFSKFYQVDSSATRRVGGTGLGLFISRRIVEAHLGHIDVRSQVGQGSVFSFSIPIEGKEG